MADATPRSANLCEKGHTMDPNWETCPYCAGESRSHKQTKRHERNPDQTMYSSSGNRNTSIGSVDRETKAMPVRESKNPHGSGGKGNTRTIVGILITYSHYPQGQLFPILEGKNYIGSGTLSSEPGHPECDIRIQTDQNMSSEHALILCRHGRFDIVDQHSTNNTFLFDEPIPIQGASLPDTAIIKTGSTIWTFMKIAESEGKGGTEPIKSPPNSVRKPKPPKPPKPQPSGNTTVR